MRITLLTFIREINPNILEQSDFVVKFYRFLILFNHSKDFFHILHHEGREEVDQKYFATFSKEVPLWSNGLYWYKKSCILRILDHLLQ